MSLAVSPTQRMRIPLVRADLQEIGANGGKGTNRPLFIPMYEVPLLAELWSGRAKVHVTALGVTGPNGRPWPEEFCFRVASLVAEEERLSKKYEKHPQSKQPIWNSIYGFGRFADSFWRAAEGRWTPQERYEPSAARAEEDAAPVVDLAAKTAPLLAAITEERPTRHPSANLPVNEDTFLPPEPVEEEDAAAKLSAATQGMPSAQKAHAGAVALLSTIPGISETIAVELINQCGVYSREELATLSLQELESVKGIGPRRAKQIMAAVAPPPSSSDVTDPLT